jgi:hypothetical protein
VSEWQDLLDFLGASVEVPVWLIAVAALAIGWLVRRPRRPADDDFDNASGYDR